RLWYMLRGLFRKLSGHSYPLSIPQKSHSLNLEAGIPRPSTLDLRPEASKPCFTFLNQSHTFGNGINWSYSKHGKLWAYNLNYFDYLQQEDISKEQGLELILDFMDQTGGNREGLEPYPISLRGINWIKFISRHGIQDQDIDASLYAQYQILLDNLEYHVDGNHLLENGCSLVFGACYFRDEQLWEAACSVMTHELQAEILDDGGHYERSVMYHSIMLERLLDCYNLIVNNNWTEKQELEDRLKRKIGLMLGWLKKMEWSDRSLPELNDHVTEMQPSPADLYHYAERLGLQSTPVELDQSGYRKYRGRGYELLADAGDIGPDYVLGHAHSDTLSFLLSIGGREVITDTGTSTYENNRRRQAERSTAAHNTVMVAGKEQNEVWSAFRVGRRAHAEILTDKPNELVAHHDGYHFLGITHERRFECSEDVIIITDRLKGASPSEAVVSYLHFSPGVEP